MVTASLGDKQIITFTNQEGIYRIADLADGTWTVKVEMRGFAPLTREIAIAAGAQPAMWELALLPYDEITRGLPPPRSQAAAPSAAAASNGSAPGQKNGNTPRPAGGPPPAPRAPAHQQREPRRRRADKRAFSARASRRHNVQRPHLAPPLPRNHRSTRMPRMTAS